MSFKRLPHELKEKILDSVKDHETLSRVSKELRHYVKTSKVAMQRELNNYFFFFAVWFNWGGTGYVSEEKSPFPNFVTHTLFIFPIVTEEQFNFFLDHQTLNTQVGAVARDDDPDCTLFWEDYNKYDGHYQCHYFHYEATEDTPIGNTEILMERLKGVEDTYEAIVQYFKELNAENYIILDYEFRDAVETPCGSTPKFSDKKTMSELLKGEHRVVRGFGEESLFIVAPSEYSNLYDFFERLFIENEEIEDENEEEEEEEFTRRTRTSYHSISKSLFKPRWWWNNNVELKTSEDYDSLTDY